IAITARHDIRRTRRMARPSTAQRPKRLGRLMKRRLRALHPGLLLGAKNAVRRGSGDGVVVIDERHVRPSISKQYFLFSVDWRERGDLLRGEERANDARGPLLQ